MIQVLIAEDELLTRMGLTSLVSWEDMGFHIVDAVSDGEQAWQSYQKYHPEVLITDIKMHKMDGLTLIKKIQEVDNSCKIIVVTCLDNLEEMIQSSGIELTGIVQKAVLSRDDLCDLLIGIKKDLDSSANASSRNNHENIALIQNSLHQLFFDSVPKTATSSALSRRIRSVLSTHNYILGVSFCAAQHRMLISISEMLKEKLEKYGDVIFSCEEGTVFYLVSSSSIIPFSSFKEITEAFSTYMYEMFSLYFRYSLCYVQNDSSIPELSKTMRNALDNPYFYPDNFYVISKEPLIENQYTELISRIRNNPVLYGFFENKEHILFEKILNELASSIGHDVTVFIACCKKLASFVSTFCFSSSKKSEILRFDPSAYSDAPHALSALYSVFPEYSPNPVYVSKMLSSIQFIHQEYFEPLSVSLLAEKISVSPNYYAILFRKMTNTNFSDFLTGIRLYHAEQMLKNSSLSIMMIAQNCGFSDSTYFTRVFRETHQMTPRQFRNTYLEKGIKS